MEISIRLIAISNNRKGEMRYAILATCQPLTDVCLSFDVLQPLHIYESHNSPTDNINSTLSGIQLALMMYIKGHSILTWNTWTTGSEEYPSSFLIQQMGHSANYMTDPVSITTLAGRVDFDPKAIVAIFSY